MQKLLTFFSKKISIYAIFNDQGSNDMLTNGIVSFEQLGPGCCREVPVVERFSKTALCEKQKKVVSYDLDGNSVSNVYQDYLQHMFPWRNKRKLLFITIFLLSGASISAQ